MGSDFQRVTVLAAGPETVVLEVAEYHPDSDAVHRILTKPGVEYAAKSLSAPLTKLAIPREKTWAARNFAAQLLSDYGETPFLAAARAFVEEEELEPDPTVFIKSVTIRALIPLEKAGNQSWLYCVTLEIRLGEPEWCAGFVVGRKYVARAFPTADWELG